MVSKWLAIVGMLVFGTASSLMSKINFEVKGYNLNGKQVPFHKPWFCVLVMFFGMTGCLIVYWIDLCIKARKQSKSKTSDDITAPLIPNDANNVEKPETKWYHSFYMLIPTIFDLIATVLMSIGLLYVTVSIYQMMRGAELIFAAIFSVLFLGKRLNKLHGLGILMTVIGISMVGSASLMAPNQNATGTKAQQVTGIVLIILSQAVQAGQICFEEFFMGNLSFEPVLVVGLEGLFGFILQGFVVLPAVYFLPGEDVGDRLENTIDSFHMMDTSIGILITLGVTAVVMLFYNLMGMSVTSHMGALFRSILETTRTLFAWIVGLILFYSNVTLYGEPLGEEWNNFSYLQAGGFVILVIGTIVYAKGDEKSFEKEIVAEQSIRIDQSAEVSAISIPQARPVSMSPHPSISTSARLNAYYDFSANSVGKSLEAGKSVLQESLPP